MGSEMCIRDRASGGARQRGGARACLLHPSSARQPITLPRARQAHRRTSAGIVQQSENIVPAISGPVCTLLNPDTCRALMPPLCLRIRATPVLVGAWTPTVGLCPIGPRPHSLLLYYTRASRPAGPRPVAPACTHSTHPVSYTHLTLPTNREV